MQDIAKEAQKLSREYKDDERIRELAKKIRAVAADVSDSDSPLAMSDHLRIRHDSRRLTGKDFSTEWLAEAMRYFTGTELGFLTGTSKSNIEGRIKYHKDTKGSGSAKFDPGSKDIEHLDPYTVYLNALKFVYNMARDDSGNAKDADKLKAISYVLQYGEAAVLDKLKEKYELLDTLGTFYINTLIPRANKRIRELLRDMEARIRAGEDTKHLAIDLRVVFRELLPTIPELKGKLVNEKWLQEDVA